MFQQIHTAMLSQAGALQMSVSTTMIGMVTSEGVIDTHPIPELHGFSPVSNLRQSQKEELERFAQIRTHLE
jgi:hypothetical protein